MKKLNAVILAAGFASRFVPLSWQTPKGLMTVRGEVLIERQIRQLREAGVEDICVVAGYQAEKFFRLADIPGVQVRVNEQYAERNNHASLYAVRDLLGDTYVCSSDNYFPENPFLLPPDGAYYAAQYAQGPTDEWCIRTDAQGYITGADIGGRDAWYMLGHTFWDEAFSRGFVDILLREYDRPGTAGKLWESIYLEHTDTLKMKMRRYPAGSILEFDSLDELRAFDAGYMEDTRCDLLARLAERLGGTQGEMSAFRPEKSAERAFSFLFRGRRYCCHAETDTLEEVQ